MPPDDGPMLSALAAHTVYIAHRGSAAMYPESSYVAYDETLLNSAAMLECDVHVLRDGTPVLMHDASVDRTTSSSGAVASFDLAGWRALRLDANAWHGSNYGNELTAPLFREWVQRYRGKAILVPEAKDAAAMKAMLDVLESLKFSREQVLLQSFSLAVLQPALKAGYQVCLLDTGGGDPAAALAAGISWVGISMSVSAAGLKGWIGSGMNVLLWTVSRRFQRDQYLGMGVKGFFSDDPVYMNATKALSTVDRFATGTWSPGMLGNGSDTSIELRGQFFAGGYWGYSTTKAGYLGCLHGYLGPVLGPAQARTFQLELKITFDAALDDDTGRWASVFLGADDKPFQDGSEWSAGYQLVFRQNGTIEIYKKALGVKGTLLASNGGGNAIAKGEEVGYRITLTEQSISAARLNGNGTDQYAALANDASVHCVYPHLGRNGLACRFRKLTIR